MSDFKLVIAVDVDNVLNNFCEMLIKIYNQENNGSLSIENITKYNFYECLDWEVCKKLEKIYSSDNFWASLTPQKYSQQGLDYLSTLGHEIYLASASDYRFWARKAGWLKYYFGMIPEKNQILIQNKGLLKCDVLVDDCIDNLLASHYYERVCFDYPYNRDVCDEARGIYRCSDWKEIVNAIDEIEYKFKSEGIDVY